MPPLSGLLGRDTDEVVAPDVALRALPQELSNGIATIVNNRQIKYPERILSACFIICV